MDTHRAGDLHLFHLGQHAQEETDYLQPLATSVLTGYSYEVGPELG